MLLSIIKALLIESLKEHVVPRPDGKPGSVSIYDPNRTSFKNAFITIVFCGVYLDAALHIQMGKYLGKAQARILDKASYEEKLRRLGCTDTSILEAVRRYRQSRREIVHEKALTEDTSLKIAQKEASFSIDLIEQINQWIESKR